jgi:hypothetical protein
MAVSQDTSQPPIVDDVELYQRRHCGKYVAADRHRMHLQNLARRKALEREAALARHTSNPDLERLENGFRCCLNGANRSPGRSGRPLDAWQRKASPPVGGQRPLRVPGAVAVEQPLDALVPPRVIRHGRRAQSLDLQGPGEDSAVTGEQTRRVRRQWAIGAPVHIKTAEGHILELHRIESTAQHEQPPPPPPPQPQQQQQQQWPGVQPDDEDE